ncbi:MAG: GLPGLI family protein [Prevotella sp.]|nr:GLPGLI family protein [Prevotella sp.]
MRIFMISVLLAFSMMAQAQQIGGMVIDKSQMKMPAKEAKKKGKNDTLAVANTTYRITYQSKAVKDTLAKPYKYRDDEMRLDISADGVSKFYSYTAELRAKVMRERVEKGVFDFRDLPKPGAFTMEFYKNYPEKGKTLMLETVGETKCQIEEKIETPEWTILPDSTADIMGYPCQLAVTHFKGRQWYAWYTEDIPLDEGPWKLRGLPGLILKAYDSSRQFIFDGQGMEQPDGEPITFIKMKREKVSQKDFRRLKESYDPNDVLKQMAGTGAKVVIVNSDGSKLDKIDRPKFNLIELQ